MIVSTHETCSNEAQAHEMLKKIDDLQHGLHAQVDNAIATHSERIEDSYLKSYKSLQDMVEKHQVMEMQVDNIHSKIKANLDVFMVQIIQVIW